MQAKAADVFALKHAGLDRFLYADVGAELNGSALTVLSMIARLGQDPWAEAARWAALPQAGVIDNLARSISQMPLAPSALAETHVTAERLVQLLPVTVQGQCQGNAAKSKTPSVLEWGSITLLYFAMFFGMAVSALLTPKMSQAVATPTIHQSKVVPEATGAATVSLPHDRGVAGLPAAPFGR